MNKMSKFDSYSRFLTWFMALLLVAFAAGCGSGGDGGRDPILGSPSLEAGLVSLAVTPATASIPIGGPQQFVATATFSDGSSRNVTVSSSWTSGTLAVATMSPNGVGGGVATGVATGTSVITATFGGLSDSANLTVTPAISVSFVVTPDPAAIPVSGIQQFTATQTFSDGTIINRTAASSWTSGTLAVATMSPNGIGGGVATGVATGTSVITATFGVLSDSANLTVTAATSVSFVVTPDPASIPVSGTQQFTATQTFSDGTIINRTAASSWTSGTLAVATMSPNGVGGGIATGVATGTSVITATFGVLSDSANLTVTAVAAGLDLGLAARFAVLAGTALTNTNPTVVTGDVGSPSQTVPPSTINGINFQNVADPELIAGLAALQVAITNANGRSCDVNFPAAIDLGGSSRGPGVYCAVGAINITGTLSLNAPGLYIFRTANTFNTASNAIVQFAGTATAANTSVFWVPVGATTLAANTTFIGTIMGSSGAITVGAVSALAPGRVLSGSAVTLSNNIITRPIP